MGTNSDQLEYLRATRLNVLSLNGWQNIYLDGVIGQYDTSGFLRDDQWAIVDEIYREVVSND